MSKRNYDEMQNTFNSTLRKVSTSNARDIKKIKNITNEKISYDTIIPDIINNGLNKYINLNLYDTLIHKKKSTQYARLMMNKINEKEKNVYKLKMQFDDIKQVEENIHIKSDIDIDIQDNNMDINKLMEMLNINDNYN